MRFALALMALSVTACAADVPSAPARPVDTRVVLAPGEMADIAAAGIQIRFQGVTGDSRCPGDALCIQGGDAVVRIDVLEPGRAASAHDLQTGEMKPVYEGDLTIALESLSPYPFISRPIACARRLPRDISSHALV